MTFSIIICNLPDHITPHYKVVHYKKLYTRFLFEGCNEETCEIWVNNRIISLGIVATSFARLIRDINCPNKEETWSRILERFDPVISDISIRVIE